MAAFNNNLTSSMNSGNEKEKVELARQSSEQDEPMLVIPNSDDPIGRWFCPHKDEHSWFACKRSHRVCGDCRKSQQGICQCCYQQMKEPLLYIWRKDDNKINRVCLAKCSFIRCQRYLLDDEVEDHKTSCDFRSILCLKTEESVQQCEREGVYMNRQIQTANNQLVPPNPDYHGVLINVPNIDRNDLNKSFRTQKIIMNENMNIPSENGPTDNISPRELGETIQQNQNVQEQMGQANYSHPRRYVTIRPTQHRNVRYPSVRRVSHLSGVTPITCLRIGNNPESAWIQRDAFLHELLPSTSPIPRGQNNPQGLMITNNVEYGRNDNQCGTLTEAEESDEDFRPDM